MKALWRLLGYLKPELSSLTVAYVCMVVLALATAFYAFLAGPALNYVFTGDITDVLRNADGTLRPLWQLFPDDWVAQVESLDRHYALMVVPALIVTTAVFKGVAQTGQFYLMGRVSQRVLRALRGDTFAALMAQPPAFYEHRAHGDLVSRLTHDTALVEQAFFYGYAPIVRDSLSVLVLLGFCFYIDAKLALVTFFIVPLAAIPLERFSRWLKRVSKRGQAAQGDINAVCYESLAGVRVVQAFGAESRESERLDRAADGYYVQMKKSYFIRAVRTPTMEILGAAALAVLLGLLGYHVQTRGADPAHYISFFVALVMMYDPIKKLGRVSDFLAAGAAAAERVFDIIDLPPAIQDIPGARDLPPFTQQVAFEAVSFSYDDGRPVLRAVDLTLARGQVVALVGASGSGKTTMANLLPRFYDVVGGRIAVDGHDVREVKLSSLRRQISLVSQDTFLFNASVRDNIAYGAPESDEEQIREAARAAHAEEFIERLPNGYHTVIGERGITLSGGQRQRLAIARALLRDKPLLILDEATSSLDVESERFVQQALDRLMDGRTSLVIAHRLSTVRHADLIAVLKDGEVVERGRHQELLDRGGEYARLYEMQFSDDGATAGETAAAHCMGGT